MINEGEFIQKSATFPIEDELSIQELALVSKSKEIPPEKSEEEVKTHNKELNLSRFDNHIIKLLKSPETKLAMANIALFNWELARDFSHYSPDEHPLGRGVSIQTEGIKGFIDLHVGSVAEMIEVMYASRIAIEIISKAVEIWTDKKISTNVKVGTSIFLGTLLPSLIELGFIDVGGNHVVDPLDVFGPLVGATYATLIWRLLTNDKLSEFTKKVLSADTDEFKLMLAGLWASVGGEVIDQLFAIAKEEVKAKVEGNDFLRNFFMPEINAEGFAVRKLDAQSTSINENQS